MESMGENGVQGRLWSPCMSENGGENGVYGREWGPWARMVSMGEIWDPWPRVGTMGHGREWCPRARMGSMGENGVHGPHGPSAKNGVHGVHERDGVHGRESVGSIFICVKGDIGEKRVRMGSEGENGVLGTIHGRQWGPVVENGVHGRE